MTNIAPPAGTQPAAGPPEDRSRREFRLVRYFSITSGIAVLVVTMVISWAYYVREVADQVNSAETRNKMLALTFANAIRPAYDTFLMQEPAATSRPADVARLTALREILERLAKGVPVVKIKIYNINGKTIYATDADEIGEDKGLNTLFRKARNGRIVSEFTRRGELSVSEGEATPFDLVSTYVPIPASDGKVTAVFELYSDVSDAVTHVEQDSLRLLAGLVVILVAFYGILLLIVGRADRVMRRQYLELTLNEAQISAKNRALQVEIDSRQEVEKALRES